MSCSTCNHWSGRTMYVVNGKVTRRCQVKEKGMREDHTCKFDTTDNVTRYDKLKNKSEKFV